MSHPVTPSTPPSTLLERRRAAALAALGGGVMVLPSAPIAFRSRDTEHRYRPDSELYYLTGVTTPGAVAVLIGGDEPEFVLFVPERDADAELWAGPRLDLDAAAERFGADVTHPASELDGMLPAILQRGDAVHYRMGRDGSLERLIVGALRAARQRGQRKGTGPRAVVDPGEILDELRLVKDDHEIGRLRAAVGITLDGHRAAAAAARPGEGEWAVQAEADAAFRRGGASGPAFPTIVGSGANACVLHYVDNRATIADGDLVLVDAGAEVDLYSGDVTRTLPASGTFSERQRAVYDIVESARAAAVAAVRPGATVADVHHAAVLCLVEGLVALGVLDGSPDALVEEEAHKPYYPHQTSHWLGLDVHDPGDYAVRGASRPLAPGMALTVEPGLYFGAASADGAAQAFAGIGVRIEDDVLVTETGAELLTSALPTAAHEVEALVAGAEPARAEG